MMETIYNLLAMFLGQPPDIINWSTRNKDNRHIVISDMTPIDFVKNMLI